jgi:hypothetical protein
LLVSFTYIATSYRSPYKGRDGEGKGRGEGGEGREGKGRGIVSIFKTLFEALPRLLSLNVNIFRPINVAQFYCSTYDQYVVISSGVARIFV